MPTKTIMKTVQKGKRQKGLEQNSKPSNLTGTNEMEDKRKYEPPNHDATQAYKDIKSSSIIKQPENSEILKNNFDWNQELVTVQEKIAGLVNQRDDLIRYHRILTSLDTNTCLKNINPKSLVSEISDLKSMVGMLQKGLNIILDEHSVIKSLVIDQVKDMNKLLERDLMREHPKSKCNNAEKPDKYIFPRNKESTRLLLNYINSNQSLFDICRASSVLNYSNNHLLETLSQTNCFGDSDKNDSMAKFRQLTELKIIIEILQKYSKIVTDEFRNINSSSVKSIKVPDHECIHFELITDGKTDQQNNLFKSYLGTPLLSPKSHLIHSNNMEPRTSSHKLEVNNPKTILEISQDSTNKSVTRSKCKIAKEAVIKDRLMSSNEFKLNSSKGPLKNVRSSYEESGKTKDSILLENDPFLKVDNKWMMVSNKCTLFGSSGQCEKKSRKKNVLFLSDGHGRYCSQFLQDELGSRFCVISVVKPDGLFEEIIQDFQHLASSFSREDYVIICAGSNNLLKSKDKTHDHIKFEVVIPILQHTNVIFTQIPLLFDYPSLNYQIRRVNSENSRKVFKLAKQNSNIFLMPKFTFFSRNCPKQNFNKFGKKTLCKVLAKIILKNSFGERQKPCHQALIPCDQTCLKPSASNPWEISGCQSFTNINELKMYKTVIGSGSTRNKDSKLERDTDSDIYQSNENEHCETTKQFKKCAQTQTCEVDYEMINEKFCKGNPDHLIEEIKVSENLKEKTKLSTQYATEQLFNIDGVVGDYCSNSNSEDHHQRQGFFAGIFMKNNHTNMTTIKELLGQGDIPKPRKNFIQENVKRLKELKLEKTNKFSSQRSKTLQPLIERRNAQTMVSSSRFSQRNSVSGRPGSQQSPSPSLRNRRTNKHVTLDTQPPIVEVDESPKGYRSQGCQTLSSKQLEHLYEEGVIRYPSVRDIGSYDEGEERTVREMALQTETSLEVLHPPPHPSNTDPPLDEGLHWDEEKKNEDKDFVKMNATVPDPRRHKTPDFSSTDPTRAPATYQRGVVPKYLREHKKEMERERINKAKEDECPEGHIQLPDDIKQKHLNTLRQNYGELVSQLNQLPVSTDTLRTRTRKKQIETDLDRIEAAIALFSREKVFVKADS